MKAKAKPVPAPAAVEDGERLNLRLPPQIRKSLEELQAKRFAEEGLTLSLNDLLLQAVIQLLRSNGFPTERVQRKSAKSARAAKTAKAAKAAQA